MVNAPDLGVLICAIATPMDAVGEVDFDRLAELTNRYIAKGVEGIYCCGSSGEGMLLSTHERERVVATVCAAAGGRVPVVAHVGSLTTRESIRLAASAQTAGACACSMIPPIYYTYRPEAVIAHYRAVMDACDLPMILYNIPQFTGQEFTVDRFAPLLEDPRVIGIKHTSMNLFELERMRARYPDKTYINGFDEIYVPALAAGATGSIGTTVGVQYELFRAARRRFQAGDIAGAMRAQERITAIVSELVAVDVFPAAKYLAARDAGPLGDCRLPLAPLGPADRRRIDALAQTLDAYLRQTAQEEAAPHH